MSMNMNMEYASGPACSAGQRGQRLFIYGRQHFALLVANFLVFGSRALTYHRVHIRVIQKLAKCLAQLLHNYDWWLKRNITFDDLDVYKCNVVIVIE